MPHAATVDGAGEQGPRALAAAVLEPPDARHPAPDQAALDQPDLDQTALDRFADLAARLLGVPTAQVALVGDVHTVVGSAGAPEGLPPRREEAPQDTICQLVAHGAEPVVVPAARADPRTADRPAVRSGLVGAYLGVPLLERGRVRGVLCVYGPEPRQWTRQDVVVLQQLAGSVQAELELTQATAELESRRLRMDLAIDAAGVGGFDWDLRNGALTWDDRLLDLFGYTRQSFPGTIAGFDDRVHPDDRARVGAALAASTGEGQEFEAEYRIVRPDGEQRWVHARGRPQLDPSGRPVHLIGAAFDVTDLHETQARLSRVLETMSAGLLSVDRAWQVSYANAEGERILGLARAELVGTGLFDLFTGDGAGGLEQACRSVVATGEPATVEVHRAGPASRDTWYEVRVWPVPDGVSVSFLDVTERRSASERADRSAARLALLAAVTSELTATLDAETAVARLARLVVPALGDFCVVTLADDDGGLRDVGWWHVDPAQAPVIDRYARSRLEALSDDSFLHRALRLGQAQVVPPPAAESVAALLRPGTAREALLALAPVSGLVVPLTARGRTLGLLTVFRSASEGAALDDITTAEEVASRAGLALDNARLYDEQRRIAEDLQRSLLTEPPEPDHAEVVVRYTPAAQAAQVGGDWYDAFLQPSGQTVVVIGDVVGHDSAAAAAMGQVRSLLRGIAFTSGAGPAEVLSRLDAAMQGLLVGTTATAVVVRLEQTPQERAQGVTRLRWSNAGHPPPMVVDADGAVLVVQAEESDLLLGIDPATPRAESVLTVDRDTTVLLYTDGLVERRDQSLDEGLDRLRRVLAELAGQPLQTLCDELIARLVPERPEDDVALVAVRLHREDQPRPPGAGPNRVPPGVP